MTDDSQSKLPLAEEFNAFVEALEKETGVSRRFLDDARPIIERAFTEVEPRMRAECLEMIRLTVQTQAETEATVRRSMIQAKQLIDAEEALCSRLHELRTEAAAAKEKVAAAAMGLFQLHLQKPSVDSN